MIESIYASMRYRDARAAIDWLERAFGFTTRVAYTGDDGAVQHAELVFGEAILMLGQWRGDGDYRAPGQGWAYVSVSDLAAHHARAVAAGAEVVEAPNDQGYGHFYAARDLEGNLWSFGTYGPAAGDPAK